MASPMKRLASGENTPVSVVSETEEEQDEDIVYLAAKDVFPFGDEPSMKGSILRTFNIPTIGLIIDFLPLIDLIHLSCVCTALNNHVNDDKIWVERYSNTFGQMPYAQLYRREVDTKTKSGWSTKQLFIWELSRASKDVPFSYLRDVWLGIARERKRKCIVLSKPSSSASCSDSSSSSSISPSSSSS
eukprot:TRINITY_DN5978_c0_g1_i1.p1 TRINITY_DN5978_c0_g1~~TRINITY_DN5978_c0_g1_i1.p1  ORF type:complete len:187 (+),score=22.27 TRINITY_DN5978_c0_g1_i1:156-716(+)